MLEKTHKTINSKSKPETAKSIPVCHIHTSFNYLPDGW